MSPGVVAKVLSEIQAPICLAVMFIGSMATSIQEQVRWFIRALVVIIQKRKAFADQLTASTS